MPVQVIRVVNGNVQVQCWQAKGGNWIAVCEPLKLTVQAQTWAELMEDFALALDAILRDLAASDEIQKFLRDKGWKLSADIPRRLKNVRFDVPFIPAMAQPYGPQREVRQ